ncbi:MAG: peptide ABC transporter substrate-binding protein [Tepidiforma sp.]|nr:MAG: peptide ABC transporter substrate-binding protein [Tepidiforma sp.]
MSNRMLALMMGVVAFLILAVGVVFVIALAGGGNDENTTPASGDGDSRPSTSAGGICNGNSLVIPGSQPNTVLDPIQVVDVSTSEYVVEIFGGLVTLDPQLQVVGDIAEKWEVSNGGRTYTFTLRDNVVFHTGNQRRVTAEDVKYSIERAADPANASPTVVAYLGNIVGLKDRFEGRAPSVSGVKVIDERTLQIDLLEPSDYFIYELTYPVSFVVDRQQIESDPRNWTRNPNGTGPFRLAEFKPAERIRLVKNPRYHLGAPKLDEVIFQLGGGSLLTQYQNDEIHTTPVPASLLDSIKDGSNPLAKDYRSYPALATFYFTLNPNKPPFDDPKVRQAFALSLDRETINSVLLFDYYDVAEGIVPGAMPGRSGTVRTYPYDPDRAKQLLSESKYAGNMPRIVLTYAGSGAAPGDVLVAIQENWQQVLGVTVELQAIDTAAFLREQRQGNFQIQSDGWSADYPDPENFLGKLFASDSPLNYTKYNNPEVDALLKQARVETNRERRYQLYAQAEQKIIDDASIIPTFWSVEHLLVKPCVQGLPNAPMTIPRYRYVEIKEP